MAHEITVKANGKASMARSNGSAKPWWESDRLVSEELPEDATIQQWIEAAGLDFEILQAPVEFTRPDGTTGVHDKRVVNYRDDNYASLSVTSKDYKLVQPRPTMTEFFQPAIEQAGFEMATAGALGDGATFWALAKTGKGFTLPGGDEFEGYLLLATACDYSLSTWARFVVNRVVCKNTLDAALLSDNGKAAGCIKQSHRSEFNFKAALNALGVVDYDRSIREMAERLHAYQGVKISDEQAKAYFNEVLGRDSSGKPRQNMQAQSFDDLLKAKATLSEDKAAVEKDPRWLTQVLESYHNAPGATPGSLYGAVNAVTHFVDHKRGYNRTRQAQAGFGLGNSLKNKAADLADAFVEDRAASATLVN